MTDIIKYITTKQELLKYTPDIMKGDILGIDTETTSLNIFQAKWLLLQILSNDTIYVINVTKCGIDSIKYLISLIKDSNKLTVGFNYKYDIEIIYNNTKELLTNVFDLFTAEILTYNGNGNAYPSLADVTFKYKNVTLNKDVRKTFELANEEITQEQILYSALDVKYLIDIMNMQTEILIEQKQTKILDLEMELVPVFAYMEYTGIPVSSEKWNINTKNAVRIAEDLQKELIEFFANSIDYSKYKNVLEFANDMKIPVSGVAKIKSLEALGNEFCKRFFIENTNTNSPQQLLRLLKIFDDKIQNTNEKTLKEFRVELPVIDKIFSYREQRKLVGTYGDNFIKLVNPITNRIHTELNQLGAATGRISSDKPNMQNIPSNKDYRSTFCVDGDYEIISADYSQAELRLLAQISKEPEMIQAFIDGLDLHKKTATFLFNKPIEEITKEERHKGKTLNFGIVYGISEYGLFFNFGIPLIDGRAYLESYFNGYKVLKNFIDIAGNVIVRNKFSKTPLGRKRFFEDKIIYDSVFDKIKYESRIKREGINHIIQGGVADIVKIAMKNIHYYNPFGDNLQMVLQVHDELVFVTHKSNSEEAKKFVVEEMTRAAQMFIKDLPVVVDAHTRPYWTKGD